MTPHGASRRQPSHMPRPLALWRRAVQDACNQFKNQGGFMTIALGIRRRTFLGGVAALGAMHGFGIDAQAAVSPSVAALPARGHVVIRNAYVMTMEPGQADLTNGDVHVDNGVIVEIGTDIA